MPPSTAGVPSRSARSATARAPTTSPPPPMPTHSTRADAHAVRLLDAAVVGERVKRQLAVGPHALLEGAAQLGLVRLADQVVALVVEGQIQEEALVLEAEVLAGFTDSTLAQGDELL